MLDNILQIKFSCISLSKIYFPTSQTKKKKKEKQGKYEIFFKIISSGNFAIPVVCCLSAKYWFQEACLVSDKHATHFSGNNTANIGKNMLSSENAFHIRHVIMSIYKDKMGAEIGKTNYYVITFVFSVESNAQMLFPLLTFNINLSLEVAGQPPSFLSRLKRKLCVKQR